MPDKYADLATNRLLFAVPLRPLQGERFQPTGFPSLGAATYPSKSGTSLLVESSQSMANRLELCVWDSTKNLPAAFVEGLSHVRVERQKAFLTDSMLESHRLNSPYLLEGDDKSFFERLKSDLGGLAAGPIDRACLARVVLKYDVGSLLHGLFLAKKELAGGRLRISRAISAFIEADGVQVAASGGVKNDHVKPSWDEAHKTKGFGNVPFARDEYTADRITLYANIDLAQTRGYGLGSEVTELLIALALLKLRLLLDGDLRLRTACDLVPIDRQVVATAPERFELPSAKTLKDQTGAAIASVRGLMDVTTVTFEDRFVEAKEQKE